MTQWSEKRILVVGGRTGMGEATAARLIELGAHVVRADLPLPGWGDSLGEIEVDVRDEGSVTQAVADASSVLGGLDIVVVCAGILGPVSPLVDLPTDDFERVISVNLRGAFLIAKSAVPELLKQQNSRLIFVASIAGKEGNPGMSAYSASKAGVIGLVKALAKEHVRDGLTVNAIAPASIETPLLAGMTPERREVQQGLIPLGRFGTTSEVASLIEYIASDEAGFTTDSSTICRVAEPPTDAEDLTEQGAQSRREMLRHVVMLKFRPDADPEAIAEYKRQMQSWPSQIPGLRSIFFGSNAGQGGEGLGGEFGGNYDFVVVSDLDDMDAYQVYATHPAHVELNRLYVRPIIQDRKAIQTFFGESDGIVLRA